jgi:DNA mismatch repair protein MutL
MLQPASLQDAYSVGEQSDSQPPVTQRPLLSEDPPPYRALTPPPASTREEPQDERVRIEDLLVIGSFKDLYIFCRNRDKLIVIDQHAAHERLLFEDLQTQYTNGRIASQQLMFPITLELSVFQSQLVEKNQEQLENMGFSIRDFGGNTWILGAVPALVSGGNPHDLFLDLLEQFGSEKDISGGNKFIDILATMACKAAVKSGDQLSDQEIKGLLAKMVKTDLFSHCPHGRPVVKILESSDIKKWFYRT